MRAAELIQESAQVLLQVAAQQSGSVERAAATIAEAFRAGRKLLICGNGGSAADSQHIAAEFVGKYLQDRRPLPCHALTTNTSSLTAIANDYGYEQVFSRQVDAFGEKGDVFWGISTSGNSRNVLEAVAMAKSRGMYTLALTGEGGGKLAPLVDLCIAVPSASVPHIQQAHITVGHVICELVEAALFG